MAKQSMLARAKKQAKTVNRLGKKKKAIKDELKNLYGSSNPDFDKIDELTEKLNKMPRNASASRVQRRCNSCGRPHAVYRRFGLCRICLRQNGMTGQVPGLRKSSW